eukprot:8357746-Heterocapsa_arctica.AAC.1
MLPEHRHVASSRLARDRVAIRVATDVDVNADRNLLSPKHLDAPWPLGHIASQTLQLLPVVVTRI